VYVNVTLQVWYMRCVRRWVLWSSRLQCRARTCPRVLWHDWMPSSECGLAHLGMKLLRIRRIDSVTSCYILILRSSNPAIKKNAFHLHPRVKMCQMFGGGWATQEIMNLVGLWAENRTLLANCLCTELETKGHRICLATWLTRRLRPQRVDQAYQNGVQSRSKWTNCNSGCCKLFKRSHWRHVRNWRKVKRTD
jgi:hypothetical protein